MRMSLILAATLLMTGTAFAQMAPAAGQFCVRGDSGANKGIETCNYQSMAQCEAAKGPGEKCFPNAQLKSESKAAGAPKAAARPDKMKSAAGASKSKSTTGSGSKN